MGNGIAQKTFVQVCDPFYLFFVFLIQNGSSNPSRSFMFFGYNLLTFTQNVLRFVPDALYTSHITRSI